MITLTRSVVKPLHVARKKGGVALITLPRRPPTKPQDKREKHRGLGFGYLTGFMIRFKRLSLPQLAHVDLTLRSWGRLHWAH